MPRHSWQKRPHWRAHVAAVSAWLTFSATAGPPRATAQEPDPIADSIIGTWIDAVGGMSTYERFSAASFTVTTVLYDTVSGREKRSRPRYVWIKKGPHGEETRVERWETGGLIQQGFNGRDPAWAAEDGVLLPDTAKDSREALYVARDLFYWIGLPFKLKDPGVYLRYLGLVPRPGRAWLQEAGKPIPPDGLYHAVGVGFGVGVGEHQDTFTYYFSPGHAFPTEVTYVEEGRTNLNRLLWGGTERVGALRYPYVTRRVWITNSGKHTKELIIFDVEINPDIPQGKFERP